MPNPTDDDRVRFHSLVPERGAVEVKQVFGNLGAFVNEHILMGCSGSDIGVGLAEENRADLLAQPGTGPFGPSERPTSGYVALPAAWTGAEAAPWV